MYGLFDLDEGFYAAVTAEMNRRGEWITPFYNGKPWFEKPILLYWLAKPSVAIFFNEFGARLPSVVASLATYWLVWRYGRRFLGELTGLGAALVLATSLFFVAVGRMMLVDPILVACLTGAFLTFWESLVGDHRWRIVTAGILGLAVLTKGPVALVFFILVAGYTFWREPELRPAYRKWWLVGFVLLTAVVSLWYLPAYLADHQLFIQEFLIKQNVQRFKGGDEAHAVPMPGSLIYYIPVVLVGMLPWAFFIPRAWPKRGLDTAEAPFRRYLATWAVVVFAFFTLSGTKLPHYVLPCFPPLALLVGHDLAGRWKTVSVARLIRFGIAALFLACFVTFGFRAYHDATQVDGDAIAAACESSSGTLPPSRLALFREARSEGDAYPSLPKPKLFGVIPIRVNETSTPSAIFYALQGSRELSLPALESDRLQELIDFGAGGVTLVVTRPGRLTSNEYAVLNSLGFERALPFTQRTRALNGDQFEILELQRQSAGQPNR
jgi:4-amino-4-deoxy-L-arabinose transferase-like glycosyltransferase